MDVSVGERGPVRVPSGDSQQADMGKISIHLYAATADALDRASAQIDRHFQGLHHSEEMPNIDTDFLKKRFVYFYFFTKHPQ